MFANLLPDAAAPPEPIKMGPGAGAPAAIVPVRMII
jgi:hypothetical protein